jgi:hypothetical protein
MDRKNDSSTQAQVDGPRLRTVTASNRASSGGGPRTPQGKAKSSKNAMKSGIFSKSPIVGDEKEEDWEKHRQGLWDSFQPVGSYEEMLVDQIALNRQQKARLQRSMDGVVQHQLDELHQVHRETLIDHLDGLPADEAIWFGFNPDEAVLTLEMVDKDSDDTALEFYQVEPVLVALRLSCELDADFTWSCVPEGLQPEDVETWNLGLIRQCLEAAATHSKKELQQVRDEALEEAEKAAFLKYLRREAAKHQYHLRAARALLPPAKDLELNMRYTASLDKEFERLIRHLENSQRARANALPPPIRIDVHEV